MREIVENQTTIVEARALMGELEKKIAFLLRDFSNSTGLLVESVDVSTAEYQTKHVEVYALLPRFYEVSIEIKMR